MSAVEDYIREQMIERYHAIAKEMYPTGEGMVMWWCPICGEERRLLANDHVCPPILQGILGD